MALLIQHTYKYMHWDKQAERRENMHVEWVNLLIGCAAYIERIHYTTCASFGNRKTSLM